VSILANSRIRTKVLVALLPLAPMQVLAARYSSIEMNRIDTRCSDLLDRDVNALHHMSIAWALSNRFAQLVYMEIAEADSDRKRVIEADLDESAAEFYSAVEEARMDGVLGRLVGARKGENHEEE
jgi:two-component system, sensor histidine kinase and response regulator